MKLIKILLLTVFVSYLAACKSTGYTVQDRQTAYLKSRSIAPTKIPPGLMSNGFSNYYPVSLRHYPENEKQISIVPPGLQGAA